MPFVAADWSITRSTGDIRYIGDTHGGASPSYVRGIELHRALQDFADNELSSGDDELSIIDQTPSDRGGVDTNITLLNGFNIDDASAEHIYDTSITQANGDEIYDGIQVFGNSDVVNVIQNGALIVNDFWNEASMIAATSDATSSTSHRFMVKVRTGGVDIDGRRLIGTQREYGTQYTEFVIGGGTNRGNNVLALTANPDNNNNTASGTVAGYTDIINLNEGYIGIDGDSNGADEFYYSQWDLGARSKNDFYEYAKYIQRSGSAETIYGLSGDIFRGITHAITLTNQSASNFDEPEEITWTGGTGQVLAVTTGEVWIQLLTGTAPSAAQVLTGATSAETAEVVAVTGQTLSFPFIGASTGSAILGAFGLGIDAADLGAADRLVDLAGATIVPPNNVTFTVNELVDGESRVLVTNDDGGNIDFDQLSVNTALTGAAETALEVAAAIPTDTPSSGTVFVQLDSGNWQSVTYTSFTGSTFTINSADFSGDNASVANNAFIAYINELAGGTTASFTSVFLAPRTLFVRVRDGGATPVKTFETTATLGSGGGGTTNIITADD